MMELVMDVMYVVGLFEFDLCRFLVYALCLLFWTWFTKALLILTHETPYNPTLAL